MAIVVEENDTFAESTAATTHSITPGVTPTDGNIMLVVLIHDEDDAYTGTPSGWTQVSGTFGNTLLTGDAYWKEASSESGAYDWTIAAGQDCILFFLELSGVDTTTPFENFDTNSGFTDSSGTSPSITPGQADSLVIAACGFDSDSYTFTFDTGNTLTEILETTVGRGNPNGVEGGIGYKTHGATATGTFTHTISTARSWGACTFNAIPSAGATPDVTYSYTLKIT